MKKRMLISHIIIVSSIFLIFGNTYTLFSYGFTPDLFLTDKLGISSIRVNNIISPKSVTELQKIISNSTTPISVIGAGYSQGGHIGYPKGIAIDTSHLNKVIAFNEEEKIITVQAGATWYDVQKHIDPYDLSVKAMQSYNNFSVGGSISINAHGRDIRYGSVINGIEAIQIVLADGNLVSASRTENTDLLKLLLADMDYWVLSLKQQ